MLDVLYMTSNMTETAKRLFLSQPTLTTRIKNLEEYYGVQLLIRKQRGVMFTPEGETLVIHARKMLREQMNIEEKLNNMKQEVTGTLRVGASNFFALNKMPKILGLFKQIYPKVEFQVVTGWSSDIHQQILNQDIHICFIKGDYKWKDKKELLYEEDVCIASPWVFKWDDLPQLPRIDYRTDSQNKSIMDDWWYSHYKEQPNINIQVSEVETCKEMVVNGLGYALLADLVIRPYPDLYVRRLTDTSGEPITRKTWMYYQEDLLKMNIVGAFVQFVRTLNIKEL